ncbi:MAG: DNA-binding protein WhiA [Firmicutes bacterium]|nr:DNA-binding protein WhiA [Bacillota bacterium]
MSFTGEVKLEIIGLNTMETEKISELSAIIHNSSIIDNYIKISSENNGVIRYIFSLIKDVYKINPKITVRRGYNYNKNYIYILEIKSKAEEILRDLGIKEDNKILSIPKSFIIDDDSLIRQYLKGVFLMCGSINDPKKSRYHLEFLVSNLEYGNYLSILLNKYNLNSKVLKRDSKYMVYVKEAEKIGDFLRILGATRSLLYYEDIRIYRDHKNMTNRLNNCEQANVERTMITANDQVKDIEVIINAGGLELLDIKEQIIANYRLKYKEASLTELSEIISIETGQTLTKSGVNHRMKKIKALAQKIREKQN